MSTSPAVKQTDHSRIVADARAVISAELQAVQALLKNAEGIDWDAAVSAILRCKGHVVVVGVGKSGIVGRKISATLASTGTPSLFLHATEALHGDIGRMTQGDVVIALSNSGESEEITKIIRPVKALGLQLIALVGSANSTLGRHADIVLAFGEMVEAGDMGLVPTASTTAMMVVGDALAICLFHARGLGREEYAQFHPGGILGRKLMRCSEVMRKGPENPVARDTITIAECIVVMTETEGRPGAVSLVDEQGVLTGFFSDGGLRRLLRRSDFDLNMCIADVMYRDCKSVVGDQLVEEAAAMLREFKIDQVPVLDDNGCPVGLLDVQDLLSTRLI